MAETTTDGENGVGEGGVGEEERRKRRQRFRVFGLVLGAAAIGGVVYWLLTRNHETSDDAFIEANVVQIAPQVGGPVVGVSFTDNQWVAAGALLLEIDPRDYAVALDSARANLDVAKAQLQANQADLDLTRATTGASIDQAQQAVAQAKEIVSQARQTADAAHAEAIRAAEDVKRYEELARSAYASRQRHEQAIADARSATARWRGAILATAAAEAQQAQAEARLVDANAAPQRIAQKEAMLATARAQGEQAQAAVHQAELNLSYTKLTAPQAGRIARRAVNLGDLVQKNQTVTNLVVAPPWVIANFKETQLTRMRPGQPVKVSVDAFPDHDFAAKVDSIQAGTGSRFSLLPAENATGNYVKVVQRVPVKIVFDAMADDMVRRLGPGLSVVPDVDVSVDPGQK